MLGTSKVTLVFFRIQIHEEIQGEAYDLVLQTKAIDTLVLKILIEIEYL